MNAKSYQRVLLYLISVLLITSLLSPWVYALWDLFLGPWLAALTEWPDHRYAFSKIFNRLFMILAISLFFPCRRLLKIGSMGQLGLQSMREGYRDLLKGFSIALGSVVFLGAMMALSEVFTVYFRLPFAVGFERSVKAIFAALTVGFLEEIFFRGMIFKGLLEDWKPTSAFIGANLFYSAIHFVKPAQKIYLDGLEPLYGIDHLIHTFERFLEPLTILPGIFGLFLLGLVLSYAFLRTNSLYLSIGLHRPYVSTGITPERTSVGYLDRLTRRSSVESPPGLGLSQWAFSSTGLQAGGLSPQAICLLQERSDLFQDSLCHQPISGAIGMDRVTLQLGIGENSFKNTRDIQSVILFCNFFVDGTVLIGKETEPQPHKDHHGPLLLDPLNYLLQIPAGLAQGDSTQEIVTAEQDNHQTGVPV